MFLRLADRVSLALIDNRLGLETGNLSELKFVLRKLRANIDVNHLRQDNPRAEFDRLADLIEAVEKVGQTSDILSVSSTLVALQAAGIGNGNLIVVGAAVFAMRDQKLLACSALVLGPL